jgi:hypothetical protein
MEISRDTPPGGGQPAAIRLRYSQSLIAVVIKKGFPFVWRSCNNGGPRITLANLISGSEAGPGMLIEKLAAGVVQVRTPIGPRYVMPSFLQRVYLVWMFRNFPILPHAVLNRRQQRMIDRMCSEQRFASMAYADGMDEAPVIGTVEHRPPIAADQLSSHRAVTSDSGRLAAEVRQRS